ncbi:MAG: ABC transporter ATP-binding protein [Candidatus Bathyarchaeota archaeon]|nr:ABC transporter ATP-binding protein [Candidatus Bathyarchaeota archaeon]
MSVVELREVTKDFGHIRALKGVTLSFKRGEKASLLGPNGAGKSTLLKIIATQMVPSSGEITVLDLDALKEREEVKRRIGVVGHRSFLYDELTVLENLRFYGSFIGSTPDDYDRVINVTNLERWRDVKTSHLSFGLRKRGDISRALLGNPELLLLDEFFSGLDRETSAALSKYMNDLTEQTVLVSSHSPELVQGFCDRAVHLRAGLVEKDVAI